MVKDINESSSSSTCLKKKFNVFAVKKSLYSDNKYKKDTISSALKQKVWDLNYKRTIGFCKCCNVNIVTMNTCHFSHILAEKNGGKTNLSNLTICCSNCNLSMGTMHLDEFKLKTGFDDNKLTNDLRHQLLIYLNEEHNRIIS